MTHPAVTPPATSFYLDAERLGAEITELCGYINAATYRLLELIREYDEGGYWAGPGLVSCAHWLNFKCGIGLNAAREKVRVAHALKELPKISEAFRRGELSYSKVRAMTRIADSSNEDYLLMIAHYGTAQHVEQLISKYRRCKRTQELAEANRQHARREFSIRYDDDGSVVFRGRLPAEQGALVMKALELAMERAPDVTAETSEDTGEIREREPYHVRRADALVRVAETSLNAEPREASTADRYQVVVHVTAETSAEDSDGAAHLEDGPHVSAETSRRIACDCSVVGILEDSKGEPLSIGRKSRSIPPAIRRALRVRDGGCRFPGCTHRAFLDGHHIEHWADGGETALGNLVQLCRRHHRLVHEGGFVCEKDETGEIRFRDARNEILPDYILPTPVVDDARIEDWMVSRMNGLDIDAETCTPRWEAGNRIDWNMAVGALFQ